MQLYSFVTEQLGWQTDINYSFLGNLNSKFINPRLLSNLYTNPTVAGSIISNLNQCIADSATIRLYEYFYNGFNTDQTNIQFENVSEIKNDIYQIRNLLKKEKFEECIKICLSLMNNSEFSIIAEYEIVSSLFECYLKKEDYRNCLILNVNTYLKNQHLADKMDVNSLLDKIVKSKFKSIGNKAELIELPIFFKINCNDRIKIKQAYELFLHANNFVKPIDLLEIKDTVSKVKLIYFFKSVCIPEIMQLSKSFDSTYSVNEERINICKYLAEIDINEINQYKNEIAELTQKNTISRVIGGIDERKVFVNELKIRQIIKKAEKQNILHSEQISPITNESFERYVKLLNFVKDNREYKVVSSIIHFEENGDVTFIETEKNKIYLEQDVDVVQYFSVYKIFVSYFLHIRDLFIFSKEYGLEAYLSTRIRHGTLPNHLRSVFESYFLVTSQTDNIYAENQYWEDKLSLSNENSLKLQNALSKFSMAIDTFSKEIKDNYIQCQNEKKKSKPEALFDFSYTEEEIIWLFVEDFIDIQNIDEFIDKTFQELWNKTEYNLENIRNKFNIDFRDKYIGLLDNLQCEIISFIDRQSVTELLNNIMTCRTEIQTKLSNISKWFRRSESSNEGEYELQILAETSIQITKNLNPSYQFDIEKRICPNLNINGEYHQHFIDLMNNCMFNIIKHAHLPSETLNAKLTIEEIDTNLILNFENCVLNPNEHLEKLKAIKQNWENPDTNISQEGGTGFPKIKKIIHSDLNRRSSNFDFHFDSNKLNIILSFETNGLKV